MADEICGSCHDGILVKILQEDGGTTKMFSCGHRLVGRAASDANISIKDSLVMEQRLGPQSTKPISSSVSHSTSAFLVSMQQEMFQDAIHFFREAKKNHDQAGDPFVTWRNLRAAVIFSFAAIEACINQFIDSHVDQNKTKLTRSEVDYWTEKADYLSIKKKLNDGVKLYGGSPLALDVRLWTDYKELQDLRDDLVHFKTGSRIFYNTPHLMSRVEKGIRTASAVIKKIYLAHRLNTAYPPVFDTTP